MVDAEEEHFKAWLKTPAAKVWWDRYASLVVKKTPETVAAMKKQIARQEADKQRWAEILQEQEDRRLAAIKAQEANQQKATEERRIFRERYFRKEEERRARQEERKRIKASYWDDDWVIRCIEKAMMLPGDI